MWDHFTQLNELRGNFETLLGKLDIVVLLTGQFFTGSKSDITWFEDLRTFKQDNVKMTSCLEFLNTYFHLMLGSKEL